MGSDCTVAIDNGIINIRVGAIIMRDGRFLMVKNEAADYLYSVGGRIKFGETAEEAVKREVFEETGYHLSIERLGFIHENYFYGDSGISKGKPVYEVSFFFYMKVPQSFEPKSASLNDDGSKESLVWVFPNCGRTIFPQFFRTELSNPQPGVKHIVTDERSRLDADSRL